MSKILGEINMAGTLPPSYYLIEHRGKILSKEDSLSEAYLSLNNHYFEVRDDGRVYLNRRVLGGPSYIIKGQPSGSLVLDDGFTKEEALKDWFRCYASKYLPYTVHRCLR
jgi:hypothetical protein